MEQGSRLATITLTAMLNLYRALREGSSSTYITGFQRFLAPVNLAVCYFASTTPA